MSEAASPGAKALIPNPALKPLEFLVGDWLTAGTHPMVPGERLNGRTSFSWHEGGAFLVMRSEVDHPQFPDGVAIIGSSDAGRFVMIYFDERGVSRIYEVTVGEGTVSWLREDPDFSQSATIRADEGGARLVGKGRIKQGEDWADDLSQVFTRDGVAGSAA
ncbi:MAG: hypothetical protein QOJ91_74 [Sphingomonadales bacterium]|jgi:hypothetical protein|nr:hypothetical protein [Sphingomonadales bacterium]